MRRPGHSSGVASNGNGKDSPAPDAEGRGARRGERQGGVPAADRAPGRPAALRHRGLGRRRQEHADRAAAVRLQAGARRPAGARRADQPADGPRLPRPVAADRRPARRARAGDHDRRRLPLLRHRPAPVHHRRHPRARAVHAQHGHRRLHGRPGDRADRRPQGRRRAVQAPRVHQLAAGRSRTWSCASTRWTSSTSTRRCSTRSSRSSTGSRRAWRCPT